MPKELIPSGDYKGGKFSYSVHNSSGAVVQVQIRQGSFFVAQRPGGGKGSNESCTWLSAGAQPVWERLRAELSWA